MHDDERFSSFVRMVNQCKREKIMKLSTGFVFFLVFYTSVYAQDTSTIVVRNPTDYSDEFIRELKNFSGLGTLELKDSLLIISGTDTVLFPSVPPLNERILFTGRKDDLAIALTINRRNYTTLEYSLEMVEFGKSSHFQNGELSLGAGFFLGEESDEDEQTGISYFVTEYTHEAADGCYISVRIGNENPLATLIKTCNQDIRDITLDDFPALHRK